MIRQVFKFWLKLKLKYYSSLPSYSEGKVYPYQWMVCGIAREDDILILEWALHYYLLGCKKIILGDFGLSDYALDLLRPLVKKGVLQIEDVRHLPLNSVEQCRFYNRILHSYRRQTKWIAFFDIDEFLGTEIDLPAKLQDLESDSSVGALVINWLMFGTSQVKDDPKIPNFMATFTRRAELNHREHKHVKSFVRTAFASGFYDQMHVPTLRNGKIAVYNSGEVFSWNQIHIENKPMFLAHYWFHSENFYKNVKIPRKIRLGHLVNSTRDWEKHKEICNAVEDQFMTRYSTQILIEAEEMKKNYS